MYYVFISVMKFWSIFELFCKFCFNFMLMLLKCKLFEFFLMVWIENNLRFYFFFGIIFFDVLEIFVFIFMFLVFVVLYFILF